ncbi:hypothetical protein MLD38_029825 [Melastoma candidum]|uniref:Uncharacterized protein n=1 Tax=Melastoma candidum TaxID=119954 RepID=A0ACB9N4X8_9MYRT|nr:hypothetical protein MLD38_029825 [Melastoma candidum]
MKTGRHCSCRTLCASATMTVLVLVLAAVVISFMVIFKVKPPSTNVNSISPGKVTVALDLARLQVHLNLALGVDLSLKNANRASFEYGNISAMLTYRGKFVGEAPISAGEVFPKGTKRMELTLTVMADQLLLSNSAALISGWCLTATRGCPGRSGSSWRSRCMARPRPGASLVYSSAIIRSAIRFF